MRRIQYDRLPQQQPSFLFLNTIFPVVICSDEPDSRTVIAINHMQLVRSTV